MRAVLPYHNTTTNAVCNAVHAQHDTKLKNTKTQSAHSITQNTTPTHPPTHPPTHQVQSRSKQPLPFAIMTSDDTHARTLHLLEAHDYYGLSKGQVGMCVWGGRAGGGGGGIAG